MSLSQQLQLLKGTQDAHHTVLVALCAWADAAPVPAPLVAPAPGGNTEALTRIEAALHDIKELLRAACAPSAPDATPKATALAKDAAPTSATAPAAPHPRRGLPSGVRTVNDQNFLTAGYHIGINTVGQSMRNANLSIRSEPPNPRFNVSIWNQSTIEHDVSRRPLEIGGCS